MTLVTYNIHGLPMIITGDNTYERIKEIGDNLNKLNPSVIHFQEDWTTYGHDILNNSLNYTSESWLNEKANIYSVFGSGLFSVSNYEEILIEKTPYKSRYGYDDFWASKGYIIQRLLIPEITNSIDFYNTHMDAENKSGDKKARKSNAEELINEMNIFSKDYPVILAGDTNLGYNSVDLETYNEFITKANLTDVADVLGVSKKIDKIMYRSTENIYINPIEYNVLDYNMSDHKAIQVTFQICES